MQCFGPRASTFNHRLVEGRRVRLVFGVERRDVYGRLLAYVHLGRRFVNAILVRRGLARSLTIPPNDRFAPLFRRLSCAPRAPAAGSGAPAALSRRDVRTFSPASASCGFATVPPRPPGHPTMRMRQSISQFETAFEQETS